MDMNQLESLKINSEARLVPVWKRKFVHTTNSNHDLPIAQNVLARQFNPSKPNLAYVSDITYIRLAIPDRC